MKRTTTIVALAVVALVASTASAQTNDHFARQRQASAQHQSNHGNHSGTHFDAPTYRPGHWGGVTTYNRFYQPSHVQGRQQNIQYYPVNPYGYGFPSYGYPGFGSPYYYGAPYGTGTYIHREIYLGR